MAKARSLCQQHVGLGRGAVIGRGNAERAMSGGLTGTVPLVLHPARAWCSYLDCWLICENCFLIMACSSVPCLQVGLCIHKAVRKSSMALLHGVQNVWEVADLSLLCPDHLVLLNQICGLCLLILLVLLHSSFFFLKFWDVNYLFLSEYGKLL